MVRQVYCLFAALCCALGNPIYVRSVNEFQVAPDYEEQFELRLLYSSSYDTVYNDTISLLDLLIVTPAGSAHVDTDIVFPVDVPVVVDRSMLNGNFDLWDDSATVWLYHYFWYGDSIKYPSEQPAPPPDWSSSRFYCFGIDTTWGPPYFFIEDWYLDSTPTFGKPNDDYPGCSVSGHVYDLYGEPVNAARVTAQTRWWYEIFCPSYLYESCTTYTDSTGSYGFSSLLPWCYAVEVSATGYVPDTLFANDLRALEPITDLDFFLNLGISEHSHAAARFKPLYPNPFHDVLYVPMNPGVFCVKIYNISGMLCRIAECKGKQEGMWLDCMDLTPGVYFVRTGPHIHKVVKQ